MTRRFKLTICALFVLAVAGPFAFTNAGAQDQPAEKFFKNIKALKGVPVSQIAALMDSYNKALGVSCDYCHVAGNLPDDSKPAHKSSVRDILMTREINDKYKHSVDCMSCHQGKAKPTTTVLASNGKTTSGTTDTSKTDTSKTDTSKTSSNTSGTKTNDKTTTTTAGGDPPTKVTYPASFGKVLFPHDSHMNMDCAKCHHTGENSKCDTCHLHNKKVSQVTQVSFYQVAHNTKGERACTACHLQMHAGPTKCAECHKK